MGMFSDLVETEPKPVAGVAVREGGHFSDLLDQGKTQRKDGRFSDLVPQNDTRFGKPYMQSLNRLLAGGSMQDVDANMTTEEMASLANVQKKMQGQESKGDQYFPVTDVPRGTTPYQLTTPDLSTPPTVDPALTDDSWFQEMLRKSYEDAEKNPPPVTPSLEEMLSGPPPPEHDPFKGEITEQGQPGGLKTSSKPATKSVEQLLEEQRWKTNANEEILRSQLKIDMYKAVTSPEYREHVNKILESIPQAQERGFIDKVKESYKRGETDIDLDIAKYMYLYHGQGSADDIRKTMARRDKEERYDPIEGGRGAEMIYSAANIMPGMLSGAKEGVGQGSAWGIAGMLAAMAGGQMGPQAGIPEEVLTVPGAGGVAFTAGYNYGAINYWYKQFSGQVAWDLIENEGIPPEIAKTVANSFAMPYALIEMSQVKRVTPTAKKSMRKTMIQSARKLAARAVARWATTTEINVLEEVGQEGVTIAAEDVGKYLGGKDVKFDFMERTKRMYQAGVEAQKGMAVIAVPGSATAMVGDVIDSRQAKTRKIIEEQTTRQAPPRPPGERITVPPKEVAPAPGFTEYEDLSGKPLPLNIDGTVTVYHRTNADPKQIKKDGFKALENTDEVFVSTKSGGEIVGYGENVIELQVYPEDLRLDDAFADEIHFAIDAKIADTIFKKQPSAPVTEAPKRPLVNTKVSALKQDQQLRKQQAWDKKYGVKQPPAARTEGEAAQPPAEVSPVIVPSGEAGVKGGKERFTDITDELLEQEWFSFAPGDVRLRKGESFRYKDKRNRRFWPVMLEQQFTRIPKESTDLLDKVRALTDEVVPLQGKQGRGYVLVPKHAIAQLQKEGVNIKKEIGKGHGEALRVRHERETRLKTTITRARILTELKGALNMPDAKPAELINAAARSDEPQYMVWAELFKNIKSGKAYTVVNPNELSEGTKIKLGDETFTVTREEDPFTGKTETLLANDITVQAEDVTRMPATEVIPPKGKLAPVKVDTGEGAEKGTQLGLLGEQGRARAGGIQTTIPFEEPSKLDKQIEREAKEAEEGEAKGQGGLFGTPGMAANVRIPVSTEPTGKSVTAQKIIEGLSRAFNVPIRGKATHKMRKVAGFYHPKARGIRQKDQFAIDTATHEVAHHLDWYINKRLSLNPPAGTAEELMALGKELYGKQKPSGGYKSEGFAEFIRHYLTTDEAQEKAPNFYKYWTEEYEPSHPREAKSLAQARKLIDRWRQQGSYARVASTIVDHNLPTSIGEKLQKAWLKVKSVWLDEFAPLRRGMMKAGITPLADVPTKDLSKTPLNYLRPSEDPYFMAITFADKAGAKANYFANEGTTDIAGNINGPSLKEVLQPVASDYKNWAVWAKSAKALQLWKLGINPGITKTDAEFIYNTYKTPAYEKALQGFTDWNRKGIDYLVEAGAMTQELADYIKDKHPIYIPFHRAFKKGEVRRMGGTGQGLTRTGQPIKKIKGSGRPTIDPIIASVQQMEKNISVAQKVMVTKALAKLSTKEGIADLIWKVPTPMKAVKFDAEQIKNDIIRLAAEHLGLDLSEGIPSGVLEKWDDMLTVFTNAQEYRGKDNIIKIDKTFYEVNPELFNMLEGLDQYRLPWMVDLLFGKPNRMVRLGATGLNAAFGLIRNPIRDIGTFAILRKHARMGPLAAVSGIAQDVLHKTGIYKFRPVQKFEAMGGKMSVQILHDKRGARYIRSEVLASSGKRWAIHTFFHPVNALREVFGLTEAGTRVGETKASLKYAEKIWGKDSKDAAFYGLFMGQDVTTNFTRHGSFGKKVNQVVTFFNATIQGPNKFYRAFRANPMRITLRGLAYLTIPALWLWWKNKDKEWYKSLPDYEKFNYVHMEKPGDPDTIIRFPVPFEVGHMFITLPIAFLDQKYRRSPDEVKRAFKEIFDRANPLEWPATIGPIIELYSNKDFAGRPIVPKRNEWKLPEDQVKPHTTLLMKQMGRFLNLSPAKLEHLAVSYSGGLYTGLARLIVDDDREKAARDIPVLGTLFVRDPYAPKLQTEQFYQEKERLDRLYASGKLKDSQLISKRKRYGAIGRKLSEYWKKLRTTNTELARKAIYKKVRLLLTKTDTMRISTKPARPKRPKRLQPAR